MAVTTWLSYWNRSIDTPASVMAECTQLRPCSDWMADSAKEAADAISGRSLRLATVERPPFVIVRRNAAGEILAFDGFCFEIINLLASKFNFTYTVQIPQDNNYGTGSSNGSWKGMIGMILANQIDMGAGPITVTNARQRVVDFTVAYFEEPTAILIPPPMEDTRLFACTKPFQWQVWIVLLTVMVVLPFILWAQFRLLWKVKKRTGPTSSGDQRRPNLFRQYLFVFAVIMTQSVRNALPSGHSPRLLAAVWSLSAVVVIYLYVGTLVSFLSVPKLRPIIFQLEDLPSSNLRWGVRAGTALEALFTESKEGIYQVIGDELVQHPELITSSDEEGFHRVANGTYAYIKEKSYLEFAIERDFVDTGQCRLSVAKQEFFKANFAFALAKNSSLQSVFSRKILQMLESGLTEYWRKKHWPSKNKCNDLKGNGSTVRSLTLHDLQSAFLVLAIGSVLSMVEFIIEISIYNMSRRF